MADSQRIEDLRRRVQKDPASIAFAQLAEECRRAGGFQEAVDVCRAGLELHPGYLSARVTLGRALIELNELDTARAELEHVLKSAAENLAAIRGLAEIHHRQGSFAEALAQYRAALALARNDPDLQQTVAELARQVEPPLPPASADGLSFEQMQSEFLQNLPAPPPKPAPIAVMPPVADAPALAESAPLPDPPSPALDVTSRYSAPSPAEAPAEIAALPDPEPPVASADATSWYATPPPAAVVDTTSSDAPPPAVVDTTSWYATPPPAAVVDTTAGYAPASPTTVADATSWYAPAPAAPEIVADAAMANDAGPIDEGVEDTAERDRAVQLIAVLEQWLGAIHVSRAQPRA
jgi:hypothetical protein